MKLSNFLKDVRITRRELGNELERRRTKSALDQELHKIVKHNRKPDISLIKATRRILHKRRKKELTEIVKRYNEYQKELDDIEYDR